jgi:hypothetical protein
MFKGLTQIASMLRQAQQLGGKLQGIRDRLKDQRATASVGAGLVEVEVNGLGDVLRVQIDPDLIQRQDRELIQDLVVAGLNEAVARSRQLHMHAMKSMTEGLDLPGLEEILAQGDLKPGGEE